VPHGILQVFIFILNENVFQNPEVFLIQVSLSPKQSTLLILVLEGRPFENEERDFPEAIDRNNEEDEEGEHDDICYYLYSKLYIILL
jgi:hypothetical protein